MTIWTRDKTCMLRAMWIEGLSGREIAERLNTTRNAVIGKANRMGLRRRDTPKRQDTKLKPQPIKTHCIRFDLHSKKKARELTIDQNIMGKGKGMMSLDVHDCRWPIGDKSPNYTFCGARVEKGSYCEHHSEKAYRIRNEEAK